MHCAEMEQVARATMRGLPPPFREHAAQLALRVEDWPDQEMLRAVGCDDANELTGLYEGIPLTEKQTGDQMLAPDTVWLFREPILAEWRARGDVTLETLIAHVVVHELAHHFGWSDADIATVDRWWE